ncbi:MAG: hypothetical protein ABSG54_19885 [Terriglobia bacterium]
MTRESLDIPNSMRKVHRRFERWRSAHAGRLPIPGPLWAAAVELAREHGVFHTAKVLHLEYGKLKRLVESAGPVNAKVPAAKGRVAKARAAALRRARSTAPPAFVELMTSQAVGLSECLIELEGRRGKMRIQWKGTTAPDLGGLSRALWESK